MKHTKAIMAGLNRPAGRMRKMFLSYTDEPSDEEQDRRVAAAEAKRARKNAKRLEEAKHAN